MAHMLPHSSRGVIEPRGILIAIDSLDLFTALIAKVSRKFIRLPGEHVNAGWKNTLPSS